MTDPSVSVPSQSPIGDGGARQLPTDEGNDRSARVEGSSGRIVENAEPTQWPAALAALLVWLFPAAMARRTIHVPLWSAYLVHLASVCASVFVIFAIVACMRVVAELNLPLTLAESMRQLYWLFGVVWSEIRRDPAADWVLGVLILAILLLLSTVGIALSLSPWGAGDEPLRASAAHAIRRVWMQTPQVAVILALLGILLVTLTVKQSAWGGRTLSDEFVIPPVAATGFLLALWMVWATLRAIGVKRVIAPVVRPPMCEGCGYNLTTMAMNARCPECGEEVIASLGPLVRLGTPWEHRSRLGAFRAWRSCFAETMLRPALFGRTILVTGHAIAYRHYLGIHLPLVFLFGVSAFWLVFGILEGKEELINDMWLWGFLSIVAGSACVLGMIGFTLSMAASMGFKWSRRERRNLLSAAAQGSCYLAGYTTLWALAGAAVTVMVATIEKGRYFRAIEDHFDIQRDTLFQVVWSLPNLVFLAWYLVLLYRIMLGTRYANR